MSSSIALPLFEFSVPNSVLRELVGRMTIIDESLEQDAQSWNMHKHLDIRSGVMMQRRAKALAQAVSEVASVAALDLEPLITRLSWLLRDLEVAPNSISSPVSIFDETDFAPNIKEIVTTDKSSWRSLEYLLGILLSELQRCEGVDLEILSRVDAEGVLRIRELDQLTMIRRTVDSLVWSDAGRDFPPASGWARERGLNETSQFASLQQFLLRVRID